MMRYICSCNSEEQPHLCIVVLPDAASNLVPSEVEGLEVDACELQLLARRVLSGRVLDDSIVAQHMHERRLACIVEAEEKDLGALAPVNHL